MAHCDEGGPKARSWRLDRKPWSDGLEPLEPAARLQVTHGKSMNCALEMEWDRLRLRRQILPDSSIYFIIFLTSLATRLELVLCPGWPCFVATSSQLHPRNPGFSSGMNSGNLLLSWLRLMAYFHVFPLCSGALAALESLSEIWFKGFFSGEFHRTSIFHGSIRGFLQIFPSTKSILTEL